MFNRKNLILMFIDLVLINVALYLGLSLRFDGEIPVGVLQSFMNLAGYFSIVRLTCFSVFGLYKKIWQYASMGELLAIFYAVTVGTIVNISLTYFLQESLPRSIFIISWVLTIGFVGGSRLIWRLYRESFRFRPVIGGRKPALIVGAGDAGAMVVRELRNRNGNGLNPIGFIDDAPGKQKQQLLGLPVLGTRKDIPNLVERYDVQQIIIAMPSAGGAVIREIMEICRETEAELKILPGMYDLLEGKVTVNSIREVQVEDLLRREPVSLDMDAIAKFVKGKTVLVTGAGGSIGSELCRQVAKLKPKTLLLLGRGENSIYAIEQELTLSYPGLQLARLIADVKDRDKLEFVFKTYKPQVVFHAAAHKHVPLMEENPEEAVKNNVLGTRTIAMAADKAGCEAFVLISTDKAVNPTSVMGTSKRIAEMVIQTLASNSKTRFVAVRFGNVLGSRGSVLPKFKEQIARGGPVTVTDERMTRYFMTIPEAVQLVLQAGAMALGGEVFVLDMGKPVKIVDLAEDVIRLSGFEPYVDIDIRYTGIRHGEKLYEEILTSEEGTTATKHERIYVAQANHIDEALLEQAIRQFEGRNWAENRDKLLELLKEIVPTYQLKQSSEKAS